MLKLIAIYFTLINIITFIAFWKDKNLARRNKERISESNLLLLSISGGATGGLAAMYLFRHKTKKARFFLTVPMLCALQIMLLALILFRKYLEVL